MIVCGVDIKSKDAIIILARKDSDIVDIVDCSTKKISLENDQDAKFLFSMKAAIEALAQQNSIDKFIVKTRKSWGKAASGGITFKIEVLFQMSGIPVVFVSPPTLAKFKKSNLGGFPSNIFGYQEDAYRAASWYLSKS